VIVRALILASLGLAGAAAPALGATVGVEPLKDGCTDRRCLGPSRQVRIVGGAGERNDIAVRPDGSGELVVSDAGAPLRVGRGCEPRPGGTASCPRDAGVLVRVEARDGDDRAIVEGVANDVSGGAGDDTLSGEHCHGGPGADVLAGVPMLPAALWNFGATLFGGSGDDQLTGSDRGDALFGGEGRDRVAAGGGDDQVIDETRRPAADVLDGGPGDDRLSFSRRKQPVHVDLSAHGAGTGSAGEGNEFAGFERLEGGAADDVLRAPAAGGDVRGGRGDDVLLGAGGEDHLDGEAGDDDVRGGGGDDALYGGTGDDRLGGGAGDDALTSQYGHDRLTGGPGRDQLATAFNRFGDGGDLLNGGAGPDRLLAGEGAGERPDRLDCGPGRRDVGEADRGDRIRGCERHRRPPARCCPRRRATVKRD
jgi:Ca2+-binding RTX toxin-like protein